MSSLPNPSYLSVTPNERSHRHRRSQAISGDFDAMGLGLFSPSSHNYSKSINSKDEIDRLYKFDNEKDFAPTNSFAFPNKERTDVSFSFPREKIFERFEKGDVSTPPRNHFTNSPNSKKLNLNSPIKLNSKKSGNLRNKFFLTDDTTITNDIPDALIDLDEVLNANLHIGNNECSNSNNSIYSDDEFLASPFLKPVSSPYAFSPSVSLPNTLFQQPIQETNDDIEVSDEETDHHHGIHDTSGTHDEALTMDEIYHPPNIPDLYCNSSANSSTSSLKNKLIEKTFSNSSKDSNNSNFLTNNTTPKRSGAKANRYQSFYDQTHKVSTALKVSSSESVNLIKSNSPNQSLQNLNHSTSNHGLLNQQSLQVFHSQSPHLNNNVLKLKDTRLAHSSSLPSLKSNRPLPKFHRYGDLRKYEINKLSPPPSLVSSNNSTSHHTSQPNNVNIATSQTSSTPQRKLKEKSEASPSSLKISNSPISIISDAGSTIISTNGTIQTDHSTISHQSLFPEQSPPSIVVSGEVEDLKTVQNSPNLSLKDNSSAFKGRRPLTPQESKLFKETKIPPFKKREVSNLKSPSHHRKSKSFSFGLDLTPKISIDDNCSIKSSKSHRFISWFKKR